MAAARSLASALLLLAAVAACSNPIDSDPAAVSVEVEPAEAEVAVGERKSFLAVVAGTASTDVTWAASGGSFTEAGGGIEWTAPSVPGEYTLTATSVANRSRSGSARVRVVEGPDTTMFASYRGTAETLPAEMFVAGEGRGGQAVGNGYDPFTGVSRLSSDSPATFDGFGAFTRDDRTFSFGIRERGDADLREARLFLRYVNAADRYVSGFRVEYDVEVWRLGERANQIRLKFHTSTDGFGQLPDIVATPNPRGRARGDSVGVVVDGTRPENRVRVSATIDLGSLGGPGGTRIGFLAPGDTGYFRWQYSNVDGDEGNVRSALAINNLRVEPILSDDPGPGPGSGSSARSPLEFSHEPGFHAAPFELELRSSLAGAMVYYTTDGSVPDPARVMGDGAWNALPRETRQRTFVYQGPLSVAALKDRRNDVSLIPTNLGQPFGEPTTAWAPPAGEVEKAVVVRALAVGADGARARATRSYFVAPQGRRRYSLPVVSLATDRASLFSPETGIYVPGAGAVRNYSQRGDEWERPVHVELFDVNGARPLAQEVGVRIHGGVTRILPQKSLRLYARSEYGAGRMRYRFFPSKPLDDFNRIVLRNGGQDWWHGLMRDAALQTLVQHLPFETQHYQPAVVFVNGEYWGLHNLRDRLDPHHLETHHGVPRDEVAILESDGQLADGRPGDELPYRDFLTRVRNGELRSAQDFDRYMDVHGYLDYVITQMYAANDDWPHTNQAWWRYTGADPAREAGPRDGRWRWLMYDVDRAFGFHTTKHTNMVEYMVAASHPDRPAWAFDLFRGLLRVPEIREEFLQRTAVHLATTFREARVRSHIEAVATGIGAEIPEHIARWRWPASIEAWTDQVGVMLDFAADRPAIFRMHVVQGIPEVSGTGVLEVTNLTGASGASLHSIRLASSTPGVSISGGRWAGRLFTGIPVVLRSQALDLRGAEVSGGVRDLVRTQDEVRFVLTGDASLRLP
jgi:hypothetical protein